MRLVVDAHALLDAAVFVTRFPVPIGDREFVELRLERLLSRDGPDLPDVELKTPVRDLLRVGGFKPAGRSKPASEYVQRAIPEERLGAINPPVDACNAASFRSGLPISVVDLDRTDGDLRIGLAPAGASYVFNASGQEIDLGGLLCLHDAVGPCANAVKDSQRTKTHVGTVRTLSVVWGTTALPGRTAATSAWYRRVLEAGGCRTEAVVPSPA